MTGDNPVQDRIDALEADEDRAHVLLERTLRLAHRSSGRRTGPTPPALAGRTLRLAVAFHRRAKAAVTELDNFINHLERHGR